ncbi:NAD(P)H-hydrate dehydratase [Alkalicoccus luteus]|uniref:Bifunctional NAD(P)H-hydrate repair enzyme n=1 Tax=Alkalicoccus luteus TaxID=1237094 RepID=A0A969TWA3_9BACI|nr:NAD(P)H-hydrate dehydratase [Alkalicoccus luteus]NJP39235.1 NAD(P)H-hydrate dehydratase [Alkalicoccus luteus]
MFALTREEMRRIDQYAINTIGIPGLVLMENAGRSAASLLLEQDKTPKRWLIIAGKGNNGGDGVVMARHLAEAGHEADVVYPEGEGALNGDGQTQRTIAEAYPIRFLDEEERVNWQAYDGIVDAMLGTGASGDPREPYASWIEAANGSGLPITALDIPSGLDADTGSVGTPCIEAVQTAALAYTKRGLEQYPGKGCAGKVSVCTIGLPEDEAARHDVRTFIGTKAAIEALYGRNRLYPARDAEANKGNYGHALIAAGTWRMNGAGLLTAAACLRMGAGLTTWAMPDALLPIAAGKQPELMYAPLADNGTGDWTSITADDVISQAEGKAVLAIGPGLGRWDGDTAWLEQIWKETDCPLVVDADALNMLAEGSGEQFPKRNRPVILTPHPGEMARLTGQSIKSVQADRVEAAKRLARDRHATIVLKGAATVTATPDGTAVINTTGNPGMATGGTGDVLAGMTASLVAQGYEPEAAAVCAVWLHGEAGDRAAYAHSHPRSLTAGDIIQAL